MNAIRELAELKQATCTGGRSAHRIHAHTLRPSPSSANASPALSNFKQSHLSHPSRWELLQSSTKVAARHAAVPRPRTDLGASLYQRHRPRPRSLDATPNLIPRSITLAVRDVLLDSRSRRYVSTLCPSSRHRFVRGASPAACPAHRPPAKRSRRRARLRSH